MNNTTQSVQQLLEDATQDHGADSKLQSFIKAKYDEAKSIKLKRENKVGVMKNFMERISNTVNDIADMGKLSRNMGNIPFVSPIPTAIMEKKCSSDFVPDLTLDPEERSGKGSDIYLARNSARVLNFGFKIGKLRREAQKGAQDLWEKGRMVLSMGFLTRKESVDSDDEQDNAEEREYQKATFIRFRQKPWETVFWTQDEHSVLFVEELTLGECIDLLGDGIKKFKIKEGNLFDSGDNDLNCDLADDLAKKIQLVHFYNDTEKIYTCQVGGQENFYKKMTGDKYPFTDEWGDGYIPVTFIDASAIKRDGHPICDLDKIFSICMNYDAIFQGIVRKVKKASNSRDIIGSGNPAQAKLAYLKGEADKSAGLDVPHFMKVEAGSSLFAKTLESPFDLNSPLALINNFLDEITMATGINLRLQSGGAETARQEELRMRRELEVIDEQIKVNESSWEQLVLNYFQMLKNVEADFYDEYVAIEDEVSDRTGIADDGSVRDIIENLAGFPFNVVISVNQSNSKRRALEIAQQENALGIIAQYAQGSPAVARMAYAIAVDKFPSLQFTEEDFIPQAEPQGQLPVGNAAIGGAPELGELTRA